MLCPHRYLCLMAKIVSEVTVININKTNKILDNQLGAHKCKIRFQINNALKKIFMLQFYAHCKVYIGNPYHPKSQYE